MMRLDIEPLGSQPLQIDAMLRSLPSFTMASGLRSPMRVHRTAELIDHDDLHLVVMEAVLTDNGSPAIFVMPTQCHTPSPTASAGICCGIASAMSTISSRARSRGITRRFAC